MGSPRRLAVLFVLLGSAPAGAVAGGQGAPASVAAPRPALFGPWSGAERARVEAVLRRLPPAIVARAAGRVLRDRRRCEPDGLPPDDDLIDARGDAHLCVTVDARGLDVGRQVALVLLYGFDRAVGWSEDPSWRALNGWRRSIAHPLDPRPDNLHTAAFVAPRAGRSPRWDLVTFTLAFLLDDEPGDGIGCRLLSQATFVRRQLRQLPPGAGLGAAQQPRCAAFEEWADLDRLADVEVVLATPSTAMAASLFGHVFLRLVYRDDDGDAPLHASWTIAFLADNEVPFTADPVYALKGIAGYYTASLHERAFLDAYREYVVLEGRDLRRWRLDATAAERRDLMERLWTMKGAGRFAYYFFRRNCATLMLDVVAQARASAGPIEAPGLLAAPPASLLESWARSRGADGAPLLQFVPEPLWSFDHRARITSRHRRELEPRILATLTGDTAASARSAFDAAHLPSPQGRAAAYERLAALIAAPGAGVDADVRAWLSDSATIESHLATLANLEAEARADRERRREIGAAVADLIRILEADAAAMRAAGGSGDAAALVGAVRRVASDDARDRLAGYQALFDVVRTLARRSDAAPVVDRARRLALFQSEARYDVARMKAAAGLRDGLLFADPDRPIDEQPYLAGRADLIRVPLVTQVSSSLRSLQRTRQALFAARGFDASEPSDEEHAAEAASVIRAESREYDGSLSRSGIDQMSALAGVTSDGAPGGGTAPVAALGGALYDERIGDHRRFGFPSDTAMVVARSEAVFSLANGPSLRSYDARLFGYRSVRRGLPESAARSPFGWEIYLDFSGNRARNLVAAPKIGWGLLMPAVERRDLGDHLMVGLGVAYEAYLPGAAPAPIGRQHGLAIPISLEARLGLGSPTSHRSWVAARMGAEPLAIGGGVPDRLLVDVSSTFEAHLALRARAESGAHDPALLLQGRVARSTLSFDRVPERSEAIVSAGLEIR